MRLFLERLAFVANLHRTDIVICSHSREEKTLSIIIGEEIRYDKYVLLMA